MATYSCILAWIIPRTEEPSELQAMGSQRVGHNWVTFTHSCTELVLGERRGLMCLTAWCKPCRVSYNMSTAEGSPKQACANSSFVSIEIPLSLPMMSKGENCPLQGSGLSGPSDQVRRARGQQSMRGWPAKGRTDVPHIKQASTGWEELRSLYFFPQLLLHWTLKTPPLPLHTHPHMLRLTLGHQLPGTPTVVLWALP